MHEAVIDHSGNTRVFQESNLYRCDPATRLHTLEGNLLGIPFKYLKKERPRLIHKTEIRPLLSILQQNISKDYNLKCNNEIKKAWKLS